MVLKPIVAYEMACLLRYYQNPQNIFSSLFRACIEFGCWRYTKEYLISKNTIDTTHEISNLVKKSPKRNAMLQKKLSIFSSRVSKILYTLSYRWTVSGE